MRLSQEYLKSVMHYDPDTGVFTRIKSTSNNTRAGDVVGFRNTRYLATSISWKTYFLHRLAFLYMTGEFPENHVDHIDGNGLNNAWSNLRAVTMSENFRNKSIGKNNTSGHPNVYWVKRQKKWHVSICKKHIGFFLTKDDAINVAKKTRAEMNFHPNHGRGLI